MEHILPEERLFDGREMLMAHDLYRREFGLMPGVIRGVAVGDYERTEIVADHIDMMTTSLHLHHGIEDAQVWPALLRRDSDDIPRVVESMQSQHTRIEELAAQVDAALTEWRNTATADARDALADAVDRFVPLLRDHMRLEEQRAVPLMEKYITAEEWGRMLHAEVSDTDPESLVLDFGMMMYEGEADLIEGAVASMPPEVQPVIRDMGSRAYAAHAKLIYGTPTPPRSTEL
jgi:hemerythrin-like domain-containing protein